VIIDVHNEEKRKKCAFFRISITHPPDDVQTAEMKSLVLYFYDHLTGVSFALWVFRGMKQNECLTLVSSVLSLMYIGSEGFQSAG
jgi:hypothetical protein